MMVSNVDGSSMGNHGPARFGGVIWIGESE